MFTISKMLIYVLFLIFMVAYGEEDAPEVKIKQGTLRGSYRQTWKGKSFRAFNGIPYAKPPVGDLRFQAPVPAEPWEGMLNATKPHAICPQQDIIFNNLDIKGDEDCLFLNVYAPKVTESDEKLPVMYYIHGGGLFCGSGNPDMYGPDILLDKDIILVTANYRLGALGFLSTEDEILPGNNGLKDQNMALRWIRENIIHFGGDPDKITLFGESAGAASVHFQMLSPLSKDLIVGVIAESGIATANWAVAPKGAAAKNAKRLAKYLNCPDESTQLMLDCLRKVKAYDIIKQDSAFMEWSYDPLMVFRPVVEPNIEGAFLVDYPADVIKSGKSAQVPLMIGFTTEDGALRTAAIYRNSTWVQELNRDFIKLAPMLLQYEAAPNKENVSKKIREFYLGDRAIDDSAKSEITDIYTDSWFQSPNNYAAELHTKYSKSPVYYYLFGYEGSVSFAPLYGDPTHKYGVVHADELIYLLSNDLFKNYVPTESDKKMNDILTTLWTNFAKTGNPTPEINSLIKTKWEPVQGETLNFYFIKSDSNISMIPNPYEKRSKFWHDLMLLNHSSQGH